MKALTRLAIAVSLTLIVSGCRTSRSVELRTSRAGVSPTHTNGVTSDTAVEIFRDVANQMGFTVQGPERVSRSKTNYIAMGPQGTRYTSPDLVLWIKPKSLRFVSSSYGTKKDWPIAQDGGDRLKKALEAHNAKYAARRFVAVSPK